MKLDRLRQEEQVTVVTMALGSQTLAIPASALREILDPLPVTRVYFRDDRFMLAPGQDHWL